MMCYTVLKFYHYVTIEDPVTFREVHHLDCIAKGLRGRIKIAREGINGTLSGTPQACTRYMQALRSDPRFAGVAFNVSSSPDPVHDKLHVRLKEEIVHSGLPDAIQPSRDLAGRRYVDATTFQQMRHEEDVVLLDVRSHFEHALGRFERSITFDIPNYRSFFKRAATYPFDRKKRYIVICTRGIKSEKARDYLVNVQRLPHVFHLEGGILDYARNSDGEGFEGVCYVFDKRLTVPINRKCPTVISSCHHCHKPSVRVVNCANATCNVHVPICAPCAEKHQGTCSEACLAHPKRRPHNGRGYYAVRSNGYNPLLGARRRVALGK